MDDHPERDDAPPRDDTPSEAPEALEAPDFGPGGYLPDRASRRARKIILRAPMGIQWVIAALTVGVVVGIAGWLALRDPAPATPFVEVPIELVATGGDGIAVWEPQGSGGEVLVATVDDRTRVFARPGGDLPVVCSESGLLEAADGRAWRVTGRGVGGTPSLTPHPAVVHDGVLWVDPTTTLEPLPPDPDPAEAACLP